MLKVVRNLLSCVCLLLVLAFLFLGAPTHAANLNASVGINPSLTLTLPTADLNLNLNPATTTFGYKDLPISISTNNETGYIMTVTTADDNTNLVNTEDSNIVLETLPAKTGGYTDSDFIVNKWGYKNGLSNNYFPFTSGDTVLENSTYTNEDSTTLRFATKIDYMQEEGTYSTTFSFNLVVNPTAPSIQNLDPALCTAAPREVIDERDDQIYTIQRLADGNCWMVTDMNLGATNITQELNSSNTNIVTPVSAATFNSWRKTFSTVSASLSSGEFIPISGTDSVSGTNYGVLYNYCVASGGSICANSYTSNATYDICPAGWRLPTGGANGEPANLYNQPNYNSYAKMRASVADGGVALDLSGAFYNTSYDYSQHTGKYGIYWTSTRETGTGTSTRVYNYRVDDTNSTFSGATYDHRSWGMAVRCILKDTRTISDVTTMQNISPQVVANTTNGTTATLTDARDGQEYTVAKINGRIWMTRNLAIGCDGTGSTYGSNMNAKRINAEQSDFYSLSSYTMPTDSLKLGSDTENTISRMECSNEYGAWYNYPATTAGTITGSTSAEATESICPRGWKIPSYTEGSTIANNATYTTLFNPSLGSNYHNGSIDPRVRGIWWFSTAYNASNRRYIYREIGQNNNNLNPAGSDGLFGLGLYLRCIAK
ncbi:hypothetical protein IKG07_02640 [Candidatus Saccharibacteria bacterium]|nr:hypothetical protein [Candidatus Saccharibacteria bacterium]